LFDKGKYYLEQQEKVKERNVSEFKNEPQNPQRLGKIRNKFGCPITLYSKGLAAPHDFCLQQKKSRYPRKESNNILNIQNSSLEYYFSASMQSDELSEVDVNILPIPSIFKKRPQGALISANNICNSNIDYKKYFEPLMTILKKNDLSKKHIAILLACTADFYNSQRHSPAIFIVQDELYSKALDLMKNVRSDKHALELITIIKKQIRELKNLAPSKIFKLHERYNHVCISIA